MRDFLSRWLRPETAGCLVCGRRSAGNAAVAAPVRHPAARAALSQLCPACLGTLPWIGSPVCRICGRPEACPDCPRREGRKLVFSRCSVRYDNSMKELLALYKYRGSEKLEPLLAAMLSGGYERMCAELPARDGSRPPFDAVVSVPLSAERLEERGFNQAERMARMLADWHGLAYRPVVRRIRHTGKQSLKTRRSRLADMKGNFAADPAVAALRDEAAARFGGGPLRLLLVDDIYTTGSTLNECAGAIREALSPAPRPRIEVYGLAWARS